MLYIVMVVVTYENFYLFFIYYLSTKITKRNEYIVYFQRELPYR